MGSRPMKKQRWNQILEKRSVRASVYTVYGVKCSSSAREDHRDADFSNRHDSKMIEYYQQKCESCIFIHHTGSKRGRDKENARGWGKEETQ